VLLPLLDLSVAGNFPIFCVVWRPCENERTARITLKDTTMIQNYFIFPPNFIFSSWPRLNFFFISCFSSIFIIEGEEEKK
jgi:hypothetical protein